MVDLAFFWKIFTSIVASMTIIATFMRLIKEFKDNTNKAKEKRIKIEKREQALNTLAENLDSINKAILDIQEQEALKGAMLSLLRFRINRLCRAIKEKGFMTMDERLDLIDLYEAYENLGGNSRTHEIYDYVIKNYKINKNEKDTIENFKKSY